MLSQPSVLKNYALLQCFVNASVIAGVLSQNDHLPYRGPEITFFNFEREDTNQNVGVQRV